MTGASSRRKGHEYERQVAHYLDTITTRNHAPGAHLDAGDLVVEGWLLEAKNHTRLELGPWLDLATAKADDDQRVALVVKRRQRPIGDSFVVMTLDTLKELL